MVMPNMAYGTIQSMNCLQGGNWITKAQLAIATTIYN